MMRGGPRLVCSPYLTGSLAIMLCIVSFNYWTVASENSDLGKKIQELQHQLQSGTNHINSIEEQLRTARDSEKNCKQASKQIKEEKEEAENKYKDINKQREDLVRQMKNEKLDEEEEERKYAEDKEMQDKIVDNLRDTIETLKINITRCEAELASERADKLIVPPAGAGGMMPPRHLPNSLGPGQLPDVRPDAVSVVRKETHGNIQ